MPVSTALHEDSVFTGCGWVFVDWCYPNLQMVQTVFRLKNFFAIVVGTFWQILPMPQPNFMRSFIVFTSLWTVWSMWNAVQPVLSSTQLALLFPFLPFSVILLAYSFFENDDDDDKDGGILQPIAQRVRSYNWLEKESFLVKDFPCRFYLLVILLETF